MLLSMRTATGPDVYTTLGSQRGASIEETTGEIDTSSKDSRAATYLPGRYGSTISCE
ncbi:MAG: phage tail protein, partial [Chloroflexi bacterium]|nr:phage tail protein [Chloroflexota bacterium]